MNLSNIFLKVKVSMDKVKFIPLLLIRLVLAYGFYGPAKMKWKDIHGIGDWFATLGIPAPYFNAFLAAGTEALGVVLLLIGLGTRFIAIPLIITMIVAIKTVHWANGFDAGQNGFEIPLYYLIMLVTLIIIGPGKISLDYLIEKRWVSHTV